MVSQRIKLPMLPRNGNRKLQIHSKIKEFVRPERSICKFSLVILNYQLTLLSSGIGQARNKENFLSEIEKIGKKLCVQYKGNLSFATSPSSLPRIRIEEVPLFVPSEAHNFESVRESSNNILIESLPYSQLTPFSQPDESEEGCVEMLLYGKCMKEICLSSHQQSNLEKTCQSLITTLLSSRYNVHEGTHEESSSFLVDDDINSSENESKGKKRKRQSQVSNIKQKKKKEKIIRPPKVYQQRYQTLKTHNEPIMYESFNFPRIAIDESNILTKDTWASFFSQYSREFNFNQLLMLGAPHEAEVECIQKYVRLKILEYR